MSCTLATIAACFSMSGLYVTGELSAADRGEGRIESRTYSESLYVPSFDKHKGGWHEQQKSERYYDTSAQNPYAFVAIGYDITPRPWVTIKLIELSHVSSISTGRDHGINRISMGVTFRPFAR